MVSKIMVPAGLLGGGFIKFGLGPDIQVLNSSVFVV